MSGNQTWVTVVGSGCPHHCAIPASQSSTGKRIALPVRKFHLPVFFKWGRTMLSTEDYKYLQLLIVLHVCVYIIIVDKINMHKRIDICFLLKYQIKKLLLAVCEFDTFSLQLWFWSFLVIGFILEISHQYPQCLVCFCTLSTFHEHVINLQKVIHPNHKAVRVPKVCINSKSLTSFGIILCTSLFWSDLIKECSHCIIK